MVLIAYWVCTGRARSVLDSVGCSRGVDLEECVTVGRAQHSQMLPQPVFTSYPDRDGLRDRKNLENRRKHATIGDVKTEGVLTVATMVSTSSTPTDLVVWIFVPTRTKHDRTVMTRNINVNTCTSGDLLESVIIFCVAFMVGETGVAAATTMTYGDQQDNDN